MSVEFIVSAVLYSFLAGLGSYGAYLAQSTRLLGSESGRESAWSDLRAEMQVVCRSSQISQLVGKSGTATKYSVIGGRLNEHERVSFRALVEVDDQVEKAGRRLRSIGAKNRFAYLCLVTALLTGVALSMPLAFGLPSIFPSLTVGIGATLGVCTLLVTVVLEIVYNRPHVEDWNFIKDKKSAATFLIEHVQK